MVPQMTPEQIEEQYQRREQLKHEITKREIEIGQMKTEVEKLRKRPVLKLEILRPVDSDEEIRTFEAIHTQYYEPEEKKLAEKTRTELTDALPQYIILLAQTNLGLKTKTVEYKTTAEIVKKLLGG